MNRLYNFHQKITPKAILTTTASAKILGGIRFITASHKEYKNKRKELMQAGISFMEEVNHSGNFYCIEW